MLYVRRLKDGNTRNRSMVIKLRREGYGFKGRGSRRRRGRRWWEWETCEACISLSPSLCSPSYWLRIRGGCEKDCNGCTSVTLSLFNRCTELCYFSFILTCFIFIYFSFFLSLHLFIPSPIPSILQHFTTKSFCNTPQPTPPTSDSWHTAHTAHTSETMRECMKKNSMNPGEIGKCNNNTPKQGRFGRTEMNKTLKRLN